MQKVSINKKTFYVEIADTPEKKRKGLMFVKSLPKDQGMLFIEDKPRIMYFWMKNCEMPLSIAFFDSNGRLFEIQKMAKQPPNTRNHPIYQSKKPAKYALEMPKNWFEENGIQISDYLIYIPER